MASAGHFLAAAPAQDHAWINAEEQCDPGYDNQANDAPAAALAHRDLESAAASARERKSESAAASIVIGSRLRLGGLRRFRFHGDLAISWECLTFHRKCARGERARSRLGRVKPVVFPKTPLARAHITRGYARCPAVHGRQTSRSFLATFSKTVGSFADMDKLLAKHGKQVSLRPSYELDLPNGLQSPRCSLVWRLAIAYQLCCMLS